MKRFAFSHHLKKYRAAYYRIVPLGLLALAVVVLAAQTLQPFKSVEVAFTDQAPSGLSIVPASCASSPQTPDSGSCGCGPAPTQSCTEESQPGGRGAYVCTAYSYSCPSGYTFDGEWCVVKGSACNTQNQNPPQTTSSSHPVVGAVRFDGCGAGGVVGWADQPTYNESYDVPVKFFVDGNYVTTMTANGDWPGLNAYIGGGGSPNDYHGFSWSIPSNYLDGKRHTYAMYGYGADGSVAELSYHNGVNYFTCAPPANQQLCPDGSAAPNNDPNQCSCASGNQKACNGGNSCPSGYTGTWPNCIPPGGSCPVGYTLQVGGGCIFLGCPAGYVQQGDKCVLTDCPSGYTRAADGSCVQQCTPHYLCGADNNLYYENASCQVSSSPTQACQYGCVGNACLPPPAATVQNFSVSPTLLQSGNRTTVAWGVQYAASCSVTGTNGDSWTGLTGTHSSSPIKGQTIYTLHCQELSGAEKSDGSPAVWTDQTATVNIVPAYQEQ